MKISVIFAVLVSVSAALVSCTNSRESSSNTGVEKNSLPTPGSTGTPVTANSNVTTSSNSSAADLDENFWETAAEGGMAEIEMARLAMQKAQNAEVKKFAQMMITEHTKANNELKALAAKQKMTLPTEIGSRHRSTLDELNRLSGAEFDREYVVAMVDDHESDVQLFEDTAENDSDPQAKAFAAKTLPVLRKHLEAIKAIDAKMK